MKLISYCIPTDDGAAPNPFFGVCTLVICKPVIRRVTAKIDDWVIGVGSKNVFDEDGNSYEGRLVYAMQVTDKMSLSEYDSYVSGHAPKKIPDLRSSDPTRWVGDCIYDYRQGTMPLQRKSVHNVINIPTDLGGKNALLSERFYYFGSKAIKIPDDLQVIVIQTQGHKYRPNEPVKERFVHWISGYKEGIHGMPYGLTETLEDQKLGNCANRRSTEDIEDEHIGDCD